MKFSEKDIDKFIQQEDKVLNNICNDIYNSSVKNCKTEEDKHKLMEEIQKIKKDML